MTEVSQELEAELQDATKVRPKKGEERQSYLKRMIAKIPNGDGWEDLSPEAQDWANNMITADNEGQPIEDFPHADNSDNEEGVEDDDSDSEKKEEGTMQTETVTNGTGTKKPKRAAPPKPGAKKSAKGAKDVPGKKKAVAPAKGPAKGTKEAATPAKPRTLKEDGVKYRIKKLMVNEPNISADEITASLKKDGDKPSKFTVAAIRSEFRHSLQVLRDLGWPKVKI